MIFFYSGRTIFAIEESPETKLQASSYAAVIMFLFVTCTPLTEQLSLQIEETWVYVSQDPAGCEAVTEQGIVRD